MIQLGISALETDLTGLCWVERYGGLTRIIDDPINATSSARYPVSSNLSLSDCANDGIYKRLVPSEEYTTLLYWEEMNDASVSLNRIVGTTSDRYSQEEIVVDGRLVIWFNLLKLGYSGTDINCQVIGDLLRVINQRRSLTNWEMRTELRSIDTEEKTRLQVFGKYSYGDVERLFLYPFQAMSVVVRFSFLGKGSCQDPFTCADEISCVNYASL